MNMIENDVFTAVYNKITATYGANTVYVTGEYTPTPPSFPCVFVYEADNYNAGFDGCNHEKLTGVMYQVEVYSNKQNGKKTEAKNLMATVDSVLTPLGFTRQSMQQLPNMADATIFRLNARYSAAVMDNTIYRR